MSRPGIAVDELKPLLELQAGECRWPVGREEGVEHFCAFTSQPDSSYCPAHHRRAYHGPGRPLNHGHLAYIGRLVGRPVEP